jgi:hypothetical protein
LGLGGNTLGQLPEVLSEEQHALFPQRLWRHGNV